jgi:hypothetical protein
MESLMRLALTPKLQVNTSIVPRDEWSDKESKHSTNYYWYFAKYYSQDAQNDQQAMSILTCPPNSKHLGTTVPNAMPKKSAAQTFPNAQNALHAT